MENREQKVRAYAHKIWEEEGRPEGHHEDHWRRAEEQYRADEGSETDENWRVEAGMTDDQPKPGITPTVLPPD